MIDDCNITNLAKNQVSAVFNSRTIRRSVSSKFIEICMGRHVGAHPDGGMGTNMADLSLSFVTKA